ncbi:isocitrate/isopropylmalate family dehydrogenase [Saccharopolyspora sp. ID03-671]|uniref:isocitrate/isopropylmalate dehydrogenase family protein n=1 Tax=Saccharopolyspora sp. ID03-671 TaxID=3073066 RepID=UPI003248F870
MRIACVDGDGIGPELMASAREVLAAAAALDELDVEFGFEAGGARTYLETGEPLVAGALERFRGEYDAVLKGPVGLPEVRKPDGTEAGVLGGVLRNGLDTYANVRPVRLLPGIRADVDRIDYVIVRENTEGLYLSRGSGVRNERAASDQLLMTRVGVERIVRFAFETARARSGAPKDGVSRVTCVDKSNVLRSFAFFRDIFDEIAADHPDVEADHRYTDAAAHDLVADPGHFDVLVTENFVGDMLSDLGAATAGGLGTCPSGNIGDDAAYFEPVHGSAPSIAGQDKANPTSQLLTAAMLLDHVGATGTARRITAAVESAYADGAVRLNPDGTPTCGTRGVTEAVLTRLRRGV